MDNIRWVGVNGYYILHSVVVTVYNARQIDIAALALKIFSNIKSFFNYWNPYNTQFPPVDETLQERDKLKIKASGLLSTSIFKNVKYISKYLPIILSPLTLGWGNTIIDIASLVGSFLMFQAEWDEFDEIMTQPYHLNDLSFFEIARRVSFILGYATSVVSVGLDLINKWSWTAEFVAYTGSLGTICGIASIILFTLGTILHIFRNYDSYKRNYLIPLKENYLLPFKDNYLIPFKNNYVIPCALTVRDVWNNTFS